MQQLWTVLGPEGSKIVVWIGVALAILIGLAILVWLGMKVFGRSLNMAGGSGRGQPQRLAITGAFSVDRKGRKLVIVRRDNVEHLLLIGGPNDVLVESGIIRAERTGRTVIPAVMRGEAETEAVAAPRADGPAPATPPMLQPVVPPAPPSPPRAPAAPPIANTSSTIVAPKRREPDFVPPPAPLAAPVKAEPAKPEVAKAEPVVAEPVKSEPVKAEPIPAPLPPVVETPAPVAPEVAIVPEAAPRPAPADPRLSDMARRLQSVLQRPLTPVAKPAAAPISDSSETIPIPLPSLRKTETPVSDPAPAAPKAPRAPTAKETAPVTQGKPLPPEPAKVDDSSIDSLEEEMARLLGRSGPDKT